MRKGCSLSVKPQSGSSGSGPTKTRWKGGIKLRRLAGRRRQSWRHRQKRWALPVLAALNLFLEQTCRRRQFLGCAISGRDFLAGRKMEDPIKFVTGPLVSVDRHVLQGRLYLCLLIPSNSGDCVEGQCDENVCLLGLALQVRLRKVEMEKRDAERIKRMEQELKEKHAANMLKRKKAEERINQALEHNAQLMRMKRAAYEQKEAEAEARRKELEASPCCLVQLGLRQQTKTCACQAARQLDASFPISLRAQLEILGIHAREEAHKKEEEHRKHLERQEKYAAALETEEMRKMSVKERAAEKERLLAELNASKCAGVRIARGASSKCCFQATQAFPPPMNTPGGALEACTAVKIAVWFCSFHVPMTCAACVQGLGCCFAPAHITKLQGAVLVYLCQVPAKLSSSAPAPHVQAQEGKRSKEGGF
eukprot:scaffold296203_cov19-Tisochrysis_lutea.AAC.1